MSAAFDIAALWVGRCVLWVGGMLLGAAIVALFAELVYECLNIAWRKFVHLENFRRVAGEMRRRGQLFRVPVATAMNDGEKR